MLKDIALKDIINISNQTFEFAKLCLNNNKFIDKEVVDQYISKMKLLLGQVYEYNRELARWYINETIVYLYYASNLSNNMSLRYNK